MQYPSYKCSVRCKHKSSHFCKYSNVTESCRNKYFFKDFADSFSDGNNVIRRLFRPVCYSYTA